MSSQSEWLVQIPDHPDVLQSRMAHLSAHLSYNKTTVEAGQLVMVGPTLSEHPKSADQGLPMNGSVMVLKVSSEDEVWQIIKENPFATTGIWNVDKAVVMPIKCVVRTPL